MGQAIGDVLALGIGVAISPLAIIAVVLILAGPHGRTSASAFLAAWVLGLSAVAAAVLVLADEADASDSGAPADWVSVAKLVLSVLLLIVAARRWRSRPGADAAAELPGWMTRLDGIAPARAAALALALASVKPKNLLLSIAAGMAIAQTGVSAGSQVVALAVFVALGTLGPAIPLAIDVFMRERGGAVLSRLREVMVRENATIIAVLCIILAAKLAGDAISALTG